MDTGVGNVVGIEADIGADTELEMESGVNSGGG